MQGFPQVYKTCWGLAEGNLSGYMWRGWGFSGKGIISCYYLYLSVLAEKCYVAAKLHSVHPPPLSAGGGRGLSVQPNFQKRGVGLTGAQLLEGGAAKEG